MYKIHKIIKSFILQKGNLRCFAYRTEYDLCTKVHIGTQTCLYVRMRVCTYACLCEFERLCLLECLRVCANFSCIRLIRYVGVSVHAIDERLTCGRASANGPIYPDTILRCLNYMKTLKLNTCTLQGLKVPCTCVLDVLLSRKKY